MAKLLDLMKTVAGRDLLFGPQGTFKYPVEWQLKMLGLDEEKVARLKGRCVLDVGCGNGDLVYYLRSRGISAEGIDACAPGDEGFMRNRITKVYPWDGCIMRGNDSYEVVLANSLNVLTNTLSSQYDASRKLTLEHTKGEERLMALFDEQIREMGGYAKATISEILRVLKTGGRFITSPDLDRLEDKIPEVVEGKYRIEREPAEFVLEIEALTRRSREMREIMATFGHSTKKGIFPDFLKNRMIIYKG